MFAGPASAAEDADFPSSRAPIRDSASLNWRRRQMSSRHLAGLHSFRIHSSRKKAEGTGSFKLQQGVFIRIVPGRRSQKDWVHKMERK